MALYKWSTRIAGIGSFPDQIQYMSQDDYDAMSETEKMNGTTYGIVGTGETPDPSLALQFEFVEKKTVTGKNFVSVWTYDYDTYVIAKTSSSNAFKVTFNNSGNVFPYYSQNAMYIDACFFSSWKAITVYNPYWNESDSFTVWIYKVNLPEE